MEDSDFVDYYEILEISPNANSGTIERMFRYLAQRYHPDNRESGDRLRFDLVLQAHDTLRDPVKRARYDIRYKNQSDFRSKLGEEVGNGIDGDAEIQSKLLSILYVKRRRNVNDPGLGDYALERLLDCPREHLEFHVWYLKAKGWVVRTDNGLLAITVEGVDRANSEQHRMATQRLLTDQGRTE
jgi:curved DNA-binding protein CbpA